MNSLKVDIAASNNTFLSRYLIWRDYCNFYQKFRDPVIEFLPGGIPLFHYTDIHNINLSSSKIILIDCLTEGIHSIDVFNKYDPTKQYIIISNGDWDPEFYHLPFKYDLMHTQFFLLEMADTYNSPNRFAYYTNKNYTFDSHKPYSFISTIGNQRRERNLLVNNLMSLHPRRKFALRYSGQDLTHPLDHLDVVTFSPGKFDPYKPIVENYYYNVSQSLPMDIYNSARFNLIVETDIDYDHCFFLTEKTIKGLITGMPFVSVSHRNFLVRLRELGFETYNSLWDESYDQEIDYKTRVKKIVELCDSLCDFDWNLHKSHLEAIKLKNQTNFLNLNKLINKEFTKFESIIEKYIQ